MTIKNQDLVFNFFASIYKEFQALSSLSIFKFAFWVFLNSRSFTSLKPIFIRRRTEDEIKKAAAVDLKDLKDPEKDSDRAKNPEWLVMVGVCTHLGCVPLGDKGDYNAWFCPCHGSHYDTSGRIRKGPAPTNLEIPKYEFVNNNIIKIG